MQFKDYTDDVFLIGLTADTNGDLYCGVFNGSKVIKIDPKYVRVDEILQTELNKHNHILPFKYFFCFFIVSGKRR